MPQGEGAVSGVVSGIVRHFRPILYNGDTDILIDSRLVCEKLAVFPHTRIPLNSVSNSLSYDIVRFKIEVGVEEKFMSKNVTKQTQHVHCDSSNNAALRDGHIIVDVGAHHSI